MFRPIVDSLLNQGQYLLLADFQSYLDCQEAVSHAYLDEQHWTRVSVLNTARMGFFSSERSVLDYACDIWHVTPLALAHPSGNSGLRRCFQVSGGGIEGVNQRKRDCRDCSGCGNRQHPCPTIRRAIPHRTAVRRLVEPTPTIAPVIV